MMNNFNENNKKYEEVIQAFMHKFSRSPLIPGQQVELDQAAGRSGHNVHYSEVRAEEIPFISSKKDLNKILTNDNIVSIFKNTIYYFNKKQMESIENTNNRAWFVRDTEEAETLARRE